MGWNGIGWNGIGVEQSTEGWVIDREAINGNGKSRSGGSGVGQHRRQQCAGWGGGERSVAQGEDTYVGHESSVKVRSHEQKVNNCKW